MHAVETARRQISAARGRTSIPFDAPTPERLAKAGPAAILGSAVRRVDVGERGAVDVIELKAPRFRVQCAFERLSKRGELDPNDGMRNQALAAAGERYALDHHRASLDGLKAINLLAGGTGGGGGLFGTESKCFAFERYCAASDAMYRKNRLAVDAVVIEGRAPVDIGAQLGNYALDKVRSALAMTALRDGLAELEAHYAAVDAGRA